MSNLVNIITKFSGKNHATNSNNTNAGKLSFDRSREKIQTIPYSIQMYTAGHTVIVYISTTAVQTASTRWRYKKRKQLLKTQWEVLTRTKIESKDYDNSDQGRKNQKILILLTI